MDNFNYLKLAKTFFYGGVVFSVISVLIFFNYKNNNLTETEDTSAAVVAPKDRDPDFGAVYKEFKLKWPSNNRSWRVNNPDAKREEAHKYLPNPVLNTDDLQYISEPFEITSEDINNDVEKVELVIDRWGGHPGTKDEQVRVNGGRWYNLPDVPTLPSDDPPEYLHHDHTVININIDDLQPGNNTLEGTTSDKSPSGWGQWGWTSSLLRIYYKDGTRTTATGSIETPSTFGENPKFTTQITSPAGISVSKVDYIAYYEGVDEDGDGYTTDWHEAYFSPKQFQEPGSFEIYGHVGTSRTAQDFPVVWNTRYIPDQATNGIKIFARIKSDNGYTYITQPKTDLTLVRNNSSVKIFHSKNVPTKWSSRKNNKNDAVRIQIPNSVNINGLKEAAMFWRTWNGKEYEWGYNGYSTNFQAVNHGFHQSYYELPTGEIKKGTAVSDGVTWIKADTEDHALEGVWPGPSLIIRTGEVWPTADVLPTQDQPTQVPTAVPSVGNTVEPSLTVTPTYLSPSVSPIPSSTSIPTPILDSPPPSVTPTIGSDGIICGAADTNDDGKFTISDFIDFADVYLSKCSDTNVDYGPCGGKDSNKSGQISISDFLSFASRYAPRQSCAL